MINEKTSIPAVGAALGLTPITPSGDSVKRTFVLTKFDRYIDIWFGKYWRCLHDTFGVSTVPPKIKCKFFDGRRLILTKLTDGKNCFFNFEIIFYHWVVNLEKCVFKTCIAAWRNIKKKHVNFVHCFQNFSCFSQSVFYCLPFLTVRVI